MTPAEYFILALFIVLGTVAIISAVLNSDWYFSTAAARSIADRFGRTAARILYIFLGLALITCGIAGIFLWST